MIANKISDTTSAVSTTAVC